jgi:Helix-turn-helix domain of resolvase
MNPAELRDTIEVYREAQQLCAIRLQVWIQGQAPAALERFVDARRAEDELVRLVLGEVDIASKQLAGRKLKLSDERIEDARRRKALGEPATSIAKTFSVSAHTVRRWV